MTKIYAPDFVGKSDQAVVILASSLDQELDGVMERFHRGDQVVYRFDWGLEKDGEQNDMVVFTLEFALGEKVAIGLSPLHWDCLPSVINLGYLVIMTDPDLLDENKKTENQEEPRALVIHNAFKGLDELAGQVNERLKTGDEPGNLDLLLRLLMEGVEETDNKQHH